MEALLLVSFFIMIGTAGLALIYWATFRAIRVSTPATRNVTAFLISVIASFFFGFTFDQWVQFYFGESSATADLGGLVTASAITVVIGMAITIPAALLVTRPSFLYVPFVLNGLLALAARLYQTASCVGWDSSAPRRRMCSADS